MQDDSTTGMTRAQRREMTASGRRSTRGRRPARETTALVADAGDGADAEVVTRPSRSARHTRAAVREGRRRRRRRTRSALAVAGVLVVTGAGVAAAWTGVIPPELTSSAWHAVGGEGEPRAALASAWSRVDEGPAAATPSPATDATAPTTEARRGTSAPAPDPGGSVDGPTSTSSTDASASDPVAGPTSAPSRTATTVEPAADTPATPAPPVTLPPAATEFDTCVALVEGRLSTSSSAYRLLVAAAGGSDLEAYCRDTVGVAVPDAVTELETTPPKDLTAGTPLDR